MPPDFRILQEEHTEILAKEIAALPEEWRLLVKLSYLEGFPLNFLAPCFAKAEEQLQEDLSLALERLRRRLSPWMQL